MGVAKALTRSTRGQKRANGRAAILSLTPNPGRKWSKRGEEAQLWAGMGRQGPREGEAPGARQRLRSTSLALRSTVRRASVTPTAKQSAVRAGVDPPR